MDQQQPTKKTAAGAPWWLLALSIVCPPCTEHGHDRTSVEVEQIKKDAAIEVAKINRDAIIQAAKISNPERPPDLHDGRGKHQR